MSISDEKKAARIERAAEIGRRWTATGIGGACVIAAAFVLLAMVRFPGHRSESVLRPLVALLLAAALVLGARALDGPIRTREHRRGHGTSSEATAALVMWLGCFATIMAAFLVSDVVARFDVPQQGGRAKSSRSSSFKVTVGDGASHMAVNREEVSADDTTMSDADPHGSAETNIRHATGGSR